MFWFNLALQGQQGGQMVQGWGAGVLSEADQTTHSQKQPLPTHHIGPFYPSPFHGAIQSESWRLPAIYLGFICTPFGIVGLFVPHAYCVHDN